MNFYNVKNIVHTHYVWAQLPDAQVFIVLAL